MFKNIFGSKKEPILEEKERQKEALVEMMQLDQEIGLYDEAAIEEMKDWEEASLIDLQLDTDMDTGEPIEELVQSPTQEFSSDYLLNSPEIVGWLSTDEQELLFSALLLFFKPSQSILDVGCGRADLFGYLSRMYDTDSINYKGIDFNPNVLEIAKQKYAGVAVETADILSIDKGADYDWVVGSGLFNLQDHADMTDYVSQCVDAMYDKAKVGIAFNLLTAIPNDMTEEDKAQLVQYQSGSWLEYFISRYGRVIARADYMLGDVTFIILK